MSSFYPEIQLEWAPTSQPTDASQTYTDITTRCRGWGWRYGRNDELAEFEPGSGFVLLDNRDRAFDPSYNAGAWYGNIKPRRMFRLRFTWNAVVYPGFIAYARGFPQQWPDGGTNATVHVELVDALAVLQGVDLAAGFTRPAENSGDRVAAVLDAVAVPAALRDIDSGTVTSAAITVADTGVSGLGHAKTVAADEHGQLFVAKDGKVTFHNRHRRINKTSALTFTDDPAGSYRYEQPFETAYDETYLWNYVIVTGPDGDQSAASDSTSIDDYHTLTRTFSSQLEFEPDRAALAQYIVSFYKDPALRAPAVSFQPAASAATLWPALLDLEVSDRVTVTRYSSAADPLTFVQNVEGVAHSWSPMGPWTTTIATSPADQNEYWVIQDASLGDIDSTNLLAP